MKDEKLKYLLCLLFLIVLAGISYRAVWPHDQVFAASDMNMGRLALKKATLPAQLTGFYVSSPVLGESGYRFILFNVLVALLPLMVSAKMLFGMILVAGSAWMVWFLRIWERSWAASLFGALVAFWFGSITLAAAGHGYKLEVLSLSVLCLCFVEKAIRAGSIRKTMGFSMLAGLTSGTMMIEQQDVALFAGLFVGSYAVFRLVRVHGRHPWHWVAVLLTIAGVALLLSGSTVLKSYSRNIAGASAVQQDSEEKWNYVTQWSMVPGEWPDLIAPGWSGWSSTDPEGPYWGKIGQSAEWETTRQGFQNFKGASVYLGLIPFLLGAFGMAHAFRNRREEDAKAVLFWAVAGVIGFLLAFGKYSILYKLFYQLPVVDNIRVPLKFLDNFQICLGIVSAYGLDRLIRAGQRARWTKAFWVACSVCGGLMLLAGMSVLAFPDGPRSEFVAMGFESFADTMVHHLSRAWLHAALLALATAGLAFVVWKGFKQARWVAFALVGILSVDSLMLTSHYLRANDISVLEKGNPVINFLKSHQGNERIFFLDQGGIYNQWLGSDVPYHQLNVFNIWQMPRMPVEYQEFLSVVGRNQLRLWELSAIQYITAPAAILEQFSAQPGLGQRFQPVLEYQVPTPQGSRPDVVLEFRGRIPRFALFTGWDALPLDRHCETLAAPDHEVQTTLLVTPESGLETQSASGQFQALDGRTTWQNAVVDVEADRPSIVRFSQRHQPGWTVTVDGEPAPLLKVDYLCMGVQVPAGKHQVEFRCVNGIPAALFALGTALVSIVASLVLIGPGRKRKE